MAICEREASFTALELPPEFRDIEGLLEADLKAIVTMVTQRAHQRLFLTKREYHELQATVWNELTEVLNNALDPLSADRR
jgi:hypothetical protein